MVFPIVLLMMSVLMSGGIGIIIFYMRSNNAAEKDRFKEGERKVEKLADELSDFKDSLPHKYVLRDDFIRTLTSFDHKLDVQGKKLDVHGKTLSEIQASMRSHHDKKST